MFTTTFATFFIFNYFRLAGFNVVGMPPTADLKGWTPPEKDQEQNNGSSPQG